MRVTLRKTEKNRKIKGQYKSHIKATLEAVSKGEIDKAKESLKKSMKSLDKAAQKKVLHKNTVARKKSRLNKVVKSLVKK